MRQPSTIRRDIERHQKAGDGAACEECIAEKNEILSLAAGMIREMREELMDDTWPLRVQAQGHAARGERREARVVMAQVEGLAGWFADWRNWLYTVPENDRLSEVKALHGKPDGERKTFAFERIGEKLGDLRAARLIGED